MGSTLNYRVVVEGKCLPDELKRALHKYFEDPIRSLAVTNTDTEFIGFLLGLESQNVPGAGKLLALIRKHSALELFEVF